MARHNESSITLKWDTVSGISMYTLQYVNDGGSVTKNVTASGEEATVEHLVSALAVGTKYDFTLFTVFEYAKSKGLSIVAVTGKRFGSVWCRRLC